MKLALILASTIALLTACGGGSDSPTPVAKVSVSEVTTNQLVYLQTSIITVKGQNLNLGINLSHKGCDKITELTGGTANQKTYSCTISTVGNVTVVITDGSGNSLYANNVNIPTPDLPKVSISEVTTDQLIYRKLSTITVKGQNLSSGFNLSHQGCLKVTELPGKTATQMTFSCKMVATGTVPVVITDGAANTLYASTATIFLAKQPQVTMTTSLGNIVLELNPARAPVTVDNFLNYVESGFYVNKIFHRVIQSFMIQGGGLNADLTQPATLAPIKLEAGNGLSNLRGTIAMARTNVLDSATSQFFINVVDNQALDTNAGGYAVFGKVVSGIETVDKIKVVPTSTRGGMSDVPVTSVLISAMLQTQ